MKKAKNIINGSLSILICLTIIISACFIGSPVKFNYEPVIVFGLAISILNILFNNIILKQKIIKNKIDIFVVIISFTTFLPLIFKTYASLNETVIGIFKYLFVLGLYISIVNVCQYDKKYVTWIINTVILSSLIISVIGLDSYSFKFFDKFLQKIGSIDSTSLKDEMFANFGYANTFALCVATASILVINNFKESENKLYKSICGAINFIFASVIFLSESRGVLLLYLIILFINCILLKKEEKTEYLVFILINFCLSIIYSYTFSNICSDGEYIKSVILTIIWIIIAAGFSILNSSISYYCSKIKFKYIIITILVFLTLGILIFLIGLKLTKPLQLYKNEYDNNDVIYKIKNIDGNTYYSFQFDIFSKSSVDMNIYEIEIQEENKYYDITTTHTIRFGNKNSREIIEFTTAEDTIELGIIFKSRSQLAQEGLTIREMKINDEIYPLNYKYLPAKLINKIVSINIQTKSIWERLIQYKDGLKLAQENLISGSGSEAWKYRVNEVESYIHTAQEMHSYIISLIIEYGIISVIAYIIVLLLLIYHFINKMKTKQRDCFFYIYLSLILMTAHSIFDFNMSFAHIQLIYYILIALISSNIEPKEKNNCKINEFFNLAVSILMIGLFSIGFYLNIQYIMYKLQFNSQKNDTELVNFLNENLVKIPYSREITEYTIAVEKNNEKECKEKIFYLLKNEPYYYREYYCNKISKMKLEDFEIEYVFNILENMKINISIEDLSSRNSTILEIAENLDRNDYSQYSKKFYELLVNEYENGKYDNIFNSFRENRLSPKEFEELKEKIYSIYNIANSNR